MIWLELWAKFQVLGSIAGIAVIICLIIYVLWLKIGRR